jgi:hypoxia up-regulated 1
MKVNLFFLLTLFQVFEKSYASSSILSIDFGTNFIKSAVLKPGIPFDILLDRDGKRKINNLIGIKKSKQSFDRIIGDNAQPWVL